MFLIIFSFRFCDFFVYESGGLMSSDLIVVWIRVFSM